MPHRRARPTSARLAGLAVAALLGALAATASACANGAAGGEELAAATPSRSSGAQAMYAAADGRPDPTPRMVIRTGAIHVVVDDVDSASDTVETRVEGMGGHVTDGVRSEKRVHLTVRVPSERLEAFLDDVAALGEEESRSISGRDVTEQYADVEAELENLVALRDRLRKLLDRAEKVEEILDVERELTRVQTRIDALSGRKERMEKDVALSSVSVELEQAPEPRILGPLGLIYEGVKWVAVKLFVISP